MRTTQWIGFLGAMLVAVSGWAAHATLTGWADLLTPQSVFGLVGAVGGVLVAFFTDKPGTPANGGGESNRPNRV
jgi:hypothetical protein